MRALCDNLSSRVTYRCTISDALRVDQNSPDALTLRGLVLFLTAKTAQALTHVTSALRLDPGHEPAQRLRKRVKDVERLKEEGNVAFKGGSLEAAVALYGEALEVSHPLSYPGTVNNLAVACWRKCRRR